MNTKQGNHLISYSFRGYRCQWICSCGRSSKKHTVDTYLGAHRKAMLHLERVGGDVKQPYRRHVVEDD